MAQILSMKGVVVDPVAAQQGTPEVNELLVSQFEQLLAMARRGEILSYIGVGRMANGMRVKAISTHPMDNVFQTLGYIEGLKVEYLKDHPIT